MSHSGAEDCHEKNLGFFRASNFGNGVVSVHFVQDVHPTDSLPQNLRSSWVAGTLHRGQAVVTFVLCIAQGDAAGNYGNHPKTC